MRSKQLASYIVLIGLAGLSGLAHREIYGLQGVGNTPWLEMSLYVVVMPLVKFAILLPGILTGYFFPSRRYVLVFVVGCLAYLPYQYIAGSGLSLDYPTLFAHSLAYSVATLVAFLAGCRLSRF